MAQQPGDPAAIEAEIDHIRSLGLDALRKRWCSTFGAAPPKALSKDLLARMIAYRIQEEAFGGLDRATIKFPTAPRVRHHVNQTDNQRAPRHMQPKYLLGDAASRELIWHVHVLRL